MPSTQEIVARLWSLCHVLRDDGITYHEYVTELTYLLFLKMAKETETETQLPSGNRWGDLERKQGVEQLDFYREILIHLGSHGSRRVQNIFSGASTSLRQPKNLAKLVEDIDQIDWYSARHEGLGDMYEGLLEKNANETKSGAGQYFTPYRSSTQSLPWSNPSLARPSRTLPAARADSSSRLTASSRPTPTVCSI